MPNACPFVTPILQCILTKQIRIPRAISVRAGAVLKALLRRDPEERLGCDKAKGFRAIKEHPFFSLLDWERLEERAVSDLFFSCFFILEFVLENI